MPPQLAPKVPLIVIVPDDVIGPPVNVRPVVPPLTPTLVAPVGGITHELLPHKKCELEGDPLAERSAVIVPLVVIRPPEIFTYDPLLVAMLVTVPPVLLIVTSFPITLVEIFVPPVSLIVPLVVMHGLPTALSASTQTLVTVPLPPPPVASIVTVVPDTLVLTFVPPAKVRVPLVVIAVPVPESAAGVMSVTVPLPPPPVPLLA